ncbi:MAG: hypothetical protein J3R72DRAFT_452080 [Linnemannia gamsii]|nr:MAG: hypothetical protein J3R72DRAFT_452080 [Linnemannia gamsii]
MPFIIVCRTPSHYVVHYVCILMFLLVVFYFPSLLLVLAAIVSFHSLSSFSLLFLFSPFHPFKLPIIAWHHPIQPLAIFYIAACFFLIPVLVPVPAQPFFCVNVVCTFLSFLSQLRQLFFF